MPLNHSIYQSDQGTSAFTKMCAIIGTLIIVLLTLLQLKYGNKVESPFETHGSVMIIFVVTMFIYASVAVATITVESAWFTNESLVPVLKLTCFAFGVLACDLLLLILFPSFGYFLLTIWVLLLLLVAFHNLFCNCKEYDEVKNFYQKCIERVFHVAPPASTESPMARTSVERQDLFTETSNDMNV